MADDNTTSDARARQEPPEFDHLGDDHLRLEHAGTVETSAAIHMRFRVVK